MTTIKDLILTIKVFINYVKNISNYVDKLKKEERTKSILRMYEHRLGVELYPLKWGYPLLPFDERLVKEDLFNWHCDEEPLVPFKEGMWDKPNWVDKTGEHVLIILDGDVGYFHKGASQLRMDSQETTKYYWKELEKRENC